MMEEIVKFLIKGAVDRLSLLSAFPFVPPSILLTISWPYQFPCYKLLCILVDKPLFQHYRQRFHRFAVFTGDVSCPLLQSFRAWLHRGLADLTPVPAPYGALQAEEVMQMTCADWQCQCQGWSCNLNQCAGQKHVEQSWPTVMVHEEFVIHVTLTWEPGPCCALCPWRDGPPAMSWPQNKFRWLVIREPAGNPS